jgi:hypothetical protein
MKPSLSPARYALVGDMVRSRSIQDYAEARRQVTQALARANRRFARALWAPLELTKGVDEFSGVAQDPAAIFDLLADLNLALHPRAFRLGVGWGEVVAFGRHGAGAMEGSGFHRASAAQARARRDHLPLALELGLGPGSLSGVLAGAIEAAAALDAALRSEWTPAIAEVVRELAGAEGRSRTQAELARKSRRSQQAISQLLIRSRWRELARGQAALRNLLGALRPEAEASAAPSPA